MSSSVIPDQILETQICSICDKYLTVSPISAVPKGGYICGRCLKSQSHCLFECSAPTDHFDIPYIILGYVNHLFPCVNRYEGCRKLLRFPEVRDHEAVCPTRKLRCALCNYTGAGTQQLHHFRVKHPKNFFDTVYFRFPLEKGYCSNLIKRDDDLFILDSEMDFNGQKIGFCVRPTTNYLEENVEFFCLLKDAADGEVIDQTTLTKRRSDGLYHTLFIRDKDNLVNCKLFCECLLRKFNRSL